ncbi:MAG TPA: ATP-binding cassette domain-containing protein, partial [Bauldia sp.]|nr:ATP-binding cassette domain-containing protein [Bauldia sp.]
HRLDEVTAICDAVTVLKDGRVVLDAPVAGLDEGEIIAHMIGREIAESDVREPGAPAEGAPVLSIEHLSGDHFDDVSVRSGTMTLAGAPLPAGDPVAAVRRGIRFAPEDRKRDGLALTRPVRENIAMGIADGSTGRGVIRLRDEAARVAEAAARVSLAPTFLDRECRHLSGGQQQKVMLARCLAEPTRGVDVGARAEIHGIIRRLARAGLAILVVSSDTKETAALCDRVLVMDRGRVSAALEGDAITREAMIAAASRTRTAADRPAAGVAPARKPPLWTRLGDAGVPVAALLVTLVVFSLFAPHFLTFQNFDGLARQIVPLALASLGAMLVILVGGIDLSIGALVSIANMLSTSLLLSHGPEVAIAATLLLGFGVGTVNAIFARLGFPAFLATYAMALVLTGVSLAQFGQSVGPVPESFWVIATAQLGPIPVATLVALLLFVLAYVVLFKSVVGRHLFAFGADAESARLNGVRPFRMLWIAYASSGLLAAATGVFLSARIGAGLPQSGLGLELEAIAAVVLGGASLFGGLVSVVGTLAGVLVLSVIANGFNLMHIDPFYSGMLRGVIMLLVVGLWAARRRSAGSA